MRCGAWLHRDRIRAQACELMQQLGFDNTNNLVGGFSEWEGPTEN